MPTRNELNKNRYARLTIEQRKQRWFYSKASIICLNLGINLHAKTLVAYIGDGNGRNNVDAVKRWLEAEYGTMTEEYGPLKIAMLTDIFNLHLRSNAPIYMAGE